MIVRPRHFVYGEYMDAEPDIAAIATLLADRTRMTFLDAVTARGPQSVGALALAAGVSASVASQHVAKLVGGGLVAVEPVGRQRIVTLASGQVAAALEALSLVAPPKRIQGLGQSHRAEAFATARSCYDHLAGRLAVGVMAGMLRRRWLTATGSDPALDVSSRGERSLERISVDVSRLRTKRRAPARACLDCTERRPHLAGAAGALMLEGFLTHGWLIRGEGRGLSVSESCREELPVWLGTDPFAESERQPPFGPHGS